MKKYILSSLAVLSAATLFTSCNDMLDTDPRKTEVTDAVFPGKVADVESELSAIYSIMNTMGGGDSDNQNIFFWWEVMSDDCFGSGGLQDNKVKSLHHLVEMSVNQYAEPYKLLYGGIARATSAIETIDNVPWREDQKSLRDQILGEAYFIRGLYYLWLSQVFGDVPLITSTVITPEMEEQADAETAIYPQILSDFVSGVNLMGTERGHGDGHANKFVAEAFIARAYMFWAGFYKNVGELASGSAPAIDLVAQEGCSAASLSQADVVNYLKDVVSNGGYKLCEDFRSLWQYSNSLLYDETIAGGGIKEIKDKLDADGKVIGKDTIRTGHGYKFIADMDRKNCFDQPGMGNGNTEELFQVQFMNASAWSISGTYNAQRMYSNYISVFWGLRNGASAMNGDREKTYPFNQGWGQGTPSCNIWDDWTAAENNQSNPYTDLRKKASLIDLDNELAGYVYEKDDCEESGYSVKKYAEVNLDACAANNDTWWSMAEGYTGSSLENKMQGDHFEDFYLMRYADVLLMLTELTGDAQYMNQVQARAGVPVTGYSLKAVQDERRWEFAFEGIRFNDMRRWTGNNPNEGSYAPKALQAQAGKQIVCLGDKSNKRTMTHMTCSWAKRYIDTNGFLSKPQTEITVKNGKLKQNPGWDAANAETQYKVLY